MADETTFKILMFPWLAHGHISPHLELAKRILQRKNFKIYICSTPINFPSINTFINKNMLQDSMHIVDLKLQPSQEFPPHYHTTKNLPPNLLFPLIDYFQSSRFSFADIIVNLKPDLIVYDVDQPWAAKICALHRIPAVHFASFSAGYLSFCYHYYTPGNKNKTGVFPFSALQCKENDVKTTVKLFEFLYATIYEADQEDLFFGCFKHSSDIVLVKTTRCFEQKYIDYISDKCEKKMVLVGPLVTSANDISSEEDSDPIIQWLNEKSPHSTVYVSFGSEYFLNDKEIEQVAKGLELCDANFIWILRFPDSEKTKTLEEALPKGFLDRVEGRGLVVSRWAPQASILANPNVTGFVSHCGWSSLNESVFYGVPVIAMPMQFDQPINAKLVVEAGLSLEVARTEDGMLNGDEMGKVISKLLEEKTGEELRFRAKEMSERMRKEEEEDLDELVDQLVMLCKKYKLQE